MSVVILVDSELGMSEQESSLKPASSRDFSPMIYDEEDIGC